MKKLITPIIASLFITIACTQVESTKEGAIVVEIDYGTQKEMKTVQTTCTEGTTALVALMKSAEVVTHPVGSHVFVTSIDSVAGERGITAWYYKINGQSAKELAVSNKLSIGDTVRWIYKEDVCSKTVDGCKKKDKMANNE